MPDLTQVTSLLHRFMAYKADGLNGLGIGELHVIVRLGNDGYPYLYNQTRKSETSWSVSTGLLT